MHLNALISAYNQSKANSVDGVDPRQNIGFENKGNKGDTGILGVKQAWVL